MKSIRPFLLMLLIAFNAYGQAENPEPESRLDQLKVAERAIMASTQDEYNQARDALAKEALAAVEKDVQSAEAELLLHWILFGSVESETSRKAVDYLIKYHATSPTAVRHLLAYAQRPGWYTPRLFEAFANADLPVELSWMVAATDAMH